jgi:hypothetical protein
MVTVLALGNISAALAGGGVMGWVLDGKNTGSFGLSARYNGMK